MNMQTPAPMTKQIETAAAKASEKLQAAREAVGQVIIGQERVITLSLATILSGGHGLLVGVPGLAKTLLVETLGTVPRAG